MTAMRTEVPTGPVELTPHCYERTCWAVSQSEDDAAKDCPPCRAHWLSMVLSGDATTGVVEPEQTGPDSIHD